MKHVPNGLYEIILKRLFDIIISLCVLVVFAPVLVTTGILIKIKLGSPVLFKQARPGRNEKIFNLYKFRTMTEAKDSNGNDLSDEERLTSFGRFLRRTSLDELPEFFNILKGDMSIVGPRPLLVRYLPAYTETERLRHAVRPGLTGLAQINGRNYVPWDERLAFDVKYVRSISLREDCRIIFKTVMLVLKHDGVAENTEDIDEGYLDEIRNCK